MPRLGRLPTDKLTLGLLRSKGWLCDLAERRTGRISRDYLGFADIVALDETGKPVAVQHTGHRNRPGKGHKDERKDKVMQNEHAQEWARRGGRVVLIWWTDEATWDAEELTEALIR